MRCKSFWFLFVLVLTTSAQARANHDNLQAVPEKGLLLSAPTVHVPMLLDSRTETEVYSEDFESGLGSWSASGSWQVGAPTSGPNSGHNSASCAATNLSGNYSNNEDSWLISPPISLPSLPAGATLELRYWEWFQIENCCDDGLTLISTNGGSSWTQLFNVTGSSVWRENSLNLIGYAGQNVTLAFRFTTDSSIVYPGWYLDDLVIVEDIPTPPPPLSVSLVGLEVDQYPYVFMTVHVDSSGVVPRVELPSNAFTVREGGTVQTDCFQVDPTGSSLLDFVFIIDHSGSMCDHIQQAYNNVVDFVQSLEGFGYDVRFGYVRIGQSQNGGSPMVMNGGALYSNAAALLQDLDGTLCNGGYEPGCQAVITALDQIQFRPGAVRQFLLVTDEDAECGPCTEAIQRCVAENVVVHGAIDCADYGGCDAFYDYCNTDPADPGLIPGTGGVLFNVEDAYDPLFAVIGGAFGSNYVLRYCPLDRTPCVVHEPEVQVSAYNEVASVSGTYTPAGAPEIQRTQETIDLASTSQVEGLPLTICAVVTDCGAPAVQEVQVFYRTSGSGGSYQSVSLVNSQGDIWCGEIPGGGVVNPGIDYYLRATDGQQTVFDPSTDPQTNPYQIAVLPNVAPLIVHVPVNASAAGVDVPIEATVIDNTYSVASVVLYYRQGGTFLYTVQAMSNTSGDLYAGLIPAAVVTAPDGVDYYIRATDDIGVGSTAGTADNPFHITVTTECYEPVAETGNWYHIVVQDATKFGSPLDTGDEIAVYDNGLVVARYEFTGTYPLDLAARGADPGHGLPGYQDGDVILFELCTHDGSRLPGQATWAEGGSFGSGGYSAASLVQFGTCSGEVSLNAAWTLISIPFLVSDPSAPAIFSGTPEVNIVQDDEGHAWIPAYGIDTVSPLRTEDAFYAYTAGSASVPVTGNPIDPSVTPIPIRAGRWNYIPYLSGRCDVACGDDISVAMASIADRVDIVIASNGFAWQPDQYNQIGAMRLGTGYRIFLTPGGDVSLTYPLCGAFRSGGAGKVGLGTPVPQPVHFQPFKTGLPEVIVIGSAQSGLLEKGDEVGIFADDTLVGSAVFDGSVPFPIPVWRADPAHNLPGFLAGAKLSVKLWPASPGRPTNANLRTELGEEAGFVFEPYLRAKLVGAGGPRPTSEVEEIAVPVDLNLTMVPNPANGATEISFGLPRATEIRLEIYSVSGQLVRVLAQGPMPAGRRSLAWDGRDAGGQPSSAGIYFVKLRSDAGAIGERLVLFR